MDKQTEELEKSIDEINKAMLRFQAWKGCFVKKKKKRF